MRGISALVVLSTVLASSARAQGSNDCSTATPIAGPGTFAVTTVGANDSPQQSGACVVAHNDVWFEWTATQSGAVTVQTCGGSTADTVLAAYAGPGCPASGTQIACNDDACGLQSTIQFGATSGNVYLIQLGAFGAATTWTGTFSIVHPVPSGNDACSAPVAIAGSGPFPFDSTFATTGAEGQSNALCGSPAGIDRDLWFTWTAPATTSMEISLCGGATFDTKVAVYAGAGCPAAGAIGCNDDSCGLQSRTFFPAVAGNTYTIQLGSYPGAAAGPGTFTIAPGSGGCPTPSSGPDVIVGNITDVLNVAASAGLDAFSLGTTACNVGDLGLNWFANTTFHPVIATNLYRYSVVDGAGRFEQVGVSWLKHGFGAATENACCVCQNPGNSQILGVGCADTYSAGLNGNQPALGPRWQVNAHTGVFTYPPANPSWSGSTARRCEVALADLSPTAGTTRFFGECTYVTPDDAAAGHGDNNTSHKEIAVSGGPLDYTFATSGGIQRMIPAIRAWALQEPGVTITDVRVPGDGLFVVGSNVTPLGGGLHHYEFAVFNQNSDRGAASFAVPVPAGALITNVGFHDVTYRNGDGPGNQNVDGADWSSSLAGGLLTWTAGTATQVPGPNAIRWGTLYNFRFDADVPPALGSIELGLWKTGTPASLLVAAEIPSGGPAAVGFCFGDGSATPCPCGNASPAGADVGCLNSFGIGGALRPAGQASVTADTFALLGSGMPNGTALYFQGDAQQNGGAGTAFGDGLRCAGGLVVRLGVRTNAGGASQVPGPGDPPISVHASDAAGDVRTYQCWYRNAASFCQAETFNLTNALQATWQP